MEIALSIFFSCRDVCARGLIYVAQGGTATVAATLGGYVDCEGVGGEKVVSASHCNIDCTYCM